MLQNKTGNFILADTKSGQTTLATATFDSHLRGWIEDPAGAEAYRSPLSLGYWPIRNRTPGRPNGCESWSNTV
jgi:hypothetical protein